MDVLSVLIKIDDWLVAANQAFIHDLMTLLIAIAAVRYRKNDNKLSIVVVVLVPAVFDILFLDDYIFSGEVASWAVFLFYASFDLLVLLLILGREWLIKGFLYLEIKLARFFGASLNNEQVFMYARHKNEYKIIVIFAVSILINLVVSAEYPARWYINDKLLYCYYLYTPLKLLLNILLVYFVFNLGSTNNISRSK